MDACRSEGLDFLPPPPPCPLHPPLRHGVWVVVYCGLHKAVLLEGWVGWGGTSGPFWKWCKGQRRILAWAGEWGCVMFSEG